MIGLAGTAKDVKPAIGAMNCAFSGLRFAPELPCSRIFLTPSSARRSNSARLGTNIPPQSDHVINLIVHQPALQSQQQGLTGLS